MPYAFGLNEGFVGSGTARSAPVGTAVGADTTAAGFEAKSDPMRATFFSAFKSMPLFWATMTEQTTPKKSTVAIKRMGANEDNRRNLGAPRDQWAFNPVVSLAIAGAEYAMPRKAPAAAIAFSGTGTEVLLDRNGKASRSTPYWLA
jgi:hypothetical protein